MLELFITVYIVPIILIGFMLSYSLSEFVKNDGKSIQFLNNIRLLDKEGHIGTFRLFVVLLLSVCPLINCFVAIYGGYWATTLYLGWNAENM